MKSKITKKHRVSSFIEYGILPDDLSDFTDAHYEILEDINTSKQSLGVLLGKYINHANTFGKQNYILRKIKQKKYMRNHINVDPNLSPEDITINEYCPFFNTKIDYRPSTQKGMSKYSYSIDRIDNSKMYTKGNIWIISRFANTIKNDSNLSELKTFSVNVIKKILKKKDLQ